MARHCPEWRSEQGPRPEGGGGGAGRSVVASGQPTALGGVCVCWYFLRLPGNAWGRPGAPRGGGRGGPHPPSTPARLRSLRAFQAAAGMLRACCSVPVTDKRKLKPRGPGCALQAPHRPAPRQGCLSPSPFIPPAGRDQTRRWKGCWLRG